MYPGKLYALLIFPSLSVVNVAPITVPLFPFPLISLAFPLKGYQATNPESRFIWANEAKAPNIKKKSKDLYIKTPKKNY